MPYSPALLQAQGDASMMQLLDKANKQLNAPAKQMPIVECSSHESQHTGTGTAAADGKDSTEQRSVLIEEIQTETSDMSKHVHEMPMGNASAKGTTAESVPPPVSLRHWENSTECFWNAVGSALAIFTRLPEHEERECNQI
jgi:hypothetical protein